MANLHWWRGISNPLVFLLVWSCLCWAIAAQATDVALPYDDLLKAYDRGDIDRARDLAQGYLLEYRTQLEEARLDLDREGALIRMLGVTLSILRGEYNLPAAGSLAPDAPLLQNLREQLRAARERYRMLPASGYSQKAYIQRDIGWSAVELIRLEASRSSRLELQTIFGEYRTEIIATGQADLESILQPPATAPEAAGLNLTPADRSRVWQTLHEYFEALADSDVSRLAAATGLGLDEAVTVLSRFHNELIQNGVERIEHLILPAEDDLPLRLRQDATCDSVYLVKLRDLHADVVLVGGERESRTWSKLIRLHRADATHWNVVPSR